MILETQINDVDVKFKGDKEDIAYISKVFFGSIATAKAIGKKTSIVKANAHTVFVNGFELSLNDGDVEKKAGTDYLICKDGSKYKLFENKEDQELSGEIIGGFHYGMCGEDFEAINNISKKNAKKIAGINAYSIWTQQHRPICEPSGMVFIPKLRIWVDIYLVGNKYKEFGTSASGQNILAGGEHNGRKKPNGKEKVLWQDFKEIGESFGKRMLTKDEFQIAMFGVKENDSARSLDDGITKHIKDFMSKYGIEQATGVQWVWSSNQYDSNEERKVLLGGNRDYAVESGSRCSAWASCLWFTFWPVGCRYACDHLEPETMSESEL